MRSGVLGGLAKERALNLRIKHYRDDEVTIEQWSDQSLEGAKDTVCQWVRDGLVDYVEIHDVNDALLFHYPWEMCRA